MMLQSFVLAALLLGAEARQAPPPPPLGRVANRTATEENYWTQWMNFREMENKDYLTQAEHDDRFEIFKSNIDKINRHNALGLSWTMGVTTFADLTAKEFKEQIVGGCTLPKRKDDSHVVDLSDVKAPASVDWEAAGKITPVKNQGQCGSCWAFSTTGAIEGRYAIKTGVLTSLSEQELVDCAGSEGNNGCRGGLMDYGFQYVKSEHGLCSEASYPYEAKTQTYECSSRRSSCGTHYDPITSYVDVRQRSTADMEAALASGPVSVAIEADQSAFQLYKSGVMSGQCGSQLDHGVLAVGYGSDGATDYWKVKNSWGANWGEQGYIRLCRNCGANRGAGQCGILGQPSYPVA